MGKPLIVDLPYPDLSGIEKDPVSAGIIRPAYGGGHGEITAILQYVYHSLFFDCYGESDISNVLIDISVAEMKHLGFLNSVRTPFTPFVRPFTSFIRRKESLTPNLRRICF